MPSHFTLILCFLLPLFACNPAQPDPIARIVTDAIRPSMDDPESFELVEISGVDTVHYNDYRRAFIHTITSDDSGLFDDEKTRRELDSMRAALTLPDSADIMQINVYARIRGKNKMGATVTDNYDLVFTKDWELVKTTISK